MQSRALASSMLTFLVFVLSSMIIVVQLASAQLTPRIISLAFSKRQVKTALGIFTFSYIYSLAALGRIEQTVPQLPVALASSPTSSPLSSSFGSFITSASGCARSSCWMKWA